MKDKIVGILKKKNLKVIEVNKETSTKNTIKTIVLAPADTILIESAMDIEIDNILKLIAKNKSVDEIVVLIDKYNNLKLLKNRAINASIDSLNACIYYELEESNKQILISSLTQLKDSIKAISKTQEGEEFDKACTNIHNLNVLLYNIQNLFVDVVNIEVSTLEEV